METLKRNCRLTQSGGSKLRRARRFHGLTLIELLATITVIALMLGLLIPAVQFAREISRRNMCSANLRQIGLGVANYETSYGCFPSGHSAQGSYLVSILPFLEQNTLADTIRDVISGNPQGISFKETVPIFKCPSDPRSANDNVGTFGGAGTNYFGCSGSYAGSQRGFDGVIIPNSFPGIAAGYVKPRDVTDGLSFTSCLAETLHADGSFSRLRVAWNLPNGSPDVKRLAMACRAVPDNPKLYGWRGDQSLKGNPWIYGGHMMTLYNHVCVPDSPSCLNGADVPRGASSVASYHSGVCNVVFADGHIALYSSSIDGDVWFALGSRNAGD